MLYNIYKTEGNAPIGITDWEHLRVMRLDFTERQLYNHRYVVTDDSAPHLFKERKPNAKFKKLGFISRDFCYLRPSGQLAIRFFNILSKYRNQFEIYFYTFESVQVDNEFGQKYGIVRKSDKFDVLAKYIADDEIDILVDMQGFMMGNFTDVLLKKPAPIIMHWLGYPGTLGLSTVDYLVADEVLVPDNSQKYYREKIAYLPHLYQSNNPGDIQSDHYVKREYFSIPNDKFVFTHFNSDYKLDRKLWFEWMDILKKTKDTILVFTVLTSNENDFFIKQLFNDVKLCGVDISRVRYIKKASRPQHHNRLQLFDLGLDTYRVNGHTTNADLVCAGVPFITCVSDTYHNRVAKSILIELDLEELVCYNFEQYKNKAIELATNKEYYLSVKQKVINNRRKVMFNTYKYTRSFVNLIYSIWDTYHINDEERKKISHVFETEDGDGVDKTEIKNIDFKMDKLSKFNHNYIGTPKFKWVFYLNKKNIEDNEPYIQSSKRKQYLRDYANLRDECNAFDTDGNLYLDVCDTDKLIDIEDKNHKYGEPQGIWIKEDIPLEEHEPDINTTLNKDYQLPKIYLYFKLEENMPNGVISDVASYLFGQYYLNCELIIISYKNGIDVQGYNFLHEHVDSITFIENVNKSDNINSLLINNMDSSDSYKLEITHDKLNDLMYVQNFYEKSIKSQ